MSQAKEGKTEAAEARPGPRLAGFGFVILQLVSLWIAWVHWQGLRRGLLRHRVIDAPDHLEGTGVLELWVHGTQPWFEWVPFIHPPGYTVFMNGSAWAAEAFADFDQAIFQQILWQGAAWKAATMALLFWAFSRWRTPGWALFAAALYAFSSNTLRPFEHYPLASLLSGFALVALVEWARRGDRSSQRLAVGAVLLAVMLHLSIWFVVGGFVAALFFQWAGRRREIATLSFVMIGLFLLTTYPGLYKVLFAGNSQVDSGPHGTLTIEWTNPVLLASCVLVFLPAGWRDRVGVSLGSAVLFFATVTLGLQHLQFADGQPYPFSLHYFELAEPAMCIAAVWGLSALVSRGGVQRWLGLGAAGLLLVSQVGFYIYCQKWIFLNIHWLWILLNPLGGG